MFDLNSPVKPLNGWHECPDGLRVSIQASRFHYCTPRDDAGPYSAVELGFPSLAPPDYIIGYAEYGDKPCDTAYGYVPVELVQRWLGEHGGVLNVE